MGSSSGVTDTVLTGTELGEILGISARRVRELRDDKVIPDNGSGQYVLGPSVAAYCGHIRPASGRAAAGGSDAATGLDAARIRLINLQADAREMLNAQMRGEAVLAEDLEVVVGTIVDGVRARVLALPTRAAPAVLGLDSLAEVRDKLTELVHEVCGSLAATELTDSVKDRARRRAGRGTDGDADTSEASASS
jgi:phage terminase Nu1 subunit (DNA packaging protein)